MAYAERVRVHKPIAFTIHVWPTSELIAKSWSWPECRREAYEQVAAVLAIAAAMQILDGGSIADGPYDIPTSLGRVEFTVSQVGSSIRISIGDFTDPHAPGPDGGIEQPSPIDGLVLGLRGSNKHFHLVVFHGFMPAIPARNRIQSEDLEDAAAYVARSDFAARVYKILSAISHLHFMVLIDSYELVFFIDIGENNISEGRITHVNRGADPASRMALPLLNFPDVINKQMKGGISEWQPWSLDLPAPPNISLQLPPPEQDMRPHLH